jgi:hypothetical protein
MLDDFTGQLGYSVHSGNPPAGRPKMTIDERIERLTERHEALTQTVELMIHENRAQQAAQERRQAAIDERFRFIGESLEKLANVATPHQHRIDDHEDRLDTIEGAS